MLASASSIEPRVMEMLICCIYDSKFDVSLASKFINIATGHDITNDNSSLLGKFYFVCIARIILEIETLILEESKAALTMTIDEMMTRLEEISKAIKNNELRKNSEKQIQNLAQRL